jgi:hypothetical protein
MSMAIFTEGNLTQGDMPLLDLLGNAQEHIQGKRNRRHE